MKYQTAYYPEVRCDVISALDDPTFVEIRIQEKEYFGYKDKLVFEDGVYFYRGRYCSEILNRCVEIELDLVDLKIEITIPIKQLRCQKVIVD